MTDVSRAGRDSRQEAPDGQREVRILITRDGRDLEVWLAGPPDGLPLVDHHGTPSCGRPTDRLVRAATERGIRLICPTRPGYGGSSPRPGRTVADVTADVADVLDHLGVQRVLVLGGSGGGPHALATAAGLARRVAAVASIAGIGPHGEDDLDFLAGMGQDNVDEFGAALAGEPALRAFLEGARPGLLDVTPAQIVEGLDSLLPPPDRACVVGRAGREPRGQLRARAQAGCRGLARR